jgi:hypothetical protein
MDVVEEVIRAHSPEKRAIIFVPRSLFPGLCLSAMITIARLVGWLLFPCNTTQHKTHNNTTTHNTQHKTHNTQHNNTQHTTQNTLQTWQGYGLGGFVAMSLAGARPYLCRAIVVGGAASNQTERGGLFLAILSLMWTSIPKPLLSRAGRYVPNRRLGHDTAKSDGSPPPPPSRTVAE